MSRQQRVTCTAAAGAAEPVTRRPQTATLRLKPRYSQIGYTVDETWNISKYASLKLNISISTYRYSPVSSNKHNCDPDTTITA